MRWKLLEISATNWSKCLIIFVVLMLQNNLYVSAIKCFVCDSTDNPSCEDLKSNSSIVPEECTLDKMKSINTWLFDLNQFAYFETDSSKSPLMNCQKVVAKDRRSDKMVTARFCQLDTGDSDACEILRSKLGQSVGMDHNYSDRRNGKQSQNGRQQGGGGGHEANGNRNEQDEQQQFHCSICKTDRCNGSTMASGSVLAVMILVAAIAVAMRMPGYW